MPKSLTKANSDGEIAEFQNCRIAGRKGLKAFPPSLSAILQSCHPAISVMDFYILLGLERGATLNDIKRAYKRLARKFHPDINPGDRMAAAHFREIAAAYETLSDPDRRRRYDSTGRASESSGQRTYGFEGFDFSVRVSGADASTFGDLFADVFQREVRQPDASERGSDLHHTLAVRFDEAI